MPAFKRYLDQCMEGVPIKDFACQKLIVKVSCRGMVWVKRHDQMKATAENTLSNCRWCGANFWRKVDFRQRMAFFLRVTKMTFGESICSFPLELTAELRADFVAVGAKINENLKALV